MEYIHATLSLKSLIHSSASFNVLLFLPKLFFMSIIVFFNSDWFFFYVFYLLFYVSYLFVDVLTSRMLIEHPLISVLKSVLFRSHASILFSTFTGVLFCLCSVQ